MRKVILHSFNNEIVRKGIAVISAVLLARTLGPEGKGQYALLTYVAAIAVSFASVGLGNAQIFLKRKYPFERVTSNILFLSLLLGIAAFIVINLAIEYIFDSIYNGINSRLVFLVTTTVPFKLITLSLKRVFQSGFKIRTYNYLKVIEPVVFLLLLVGCYCFFDVDIELVVLLFVSSGILNFFLTIFIS